MGKLKKIVATLVAVATVGALSVGAFASYTYGTIFKDTITSKTSQAFDLGTHSYTGNDIGATYMLRRPLGLIITLNCMWTADSLESIISTVNQWHVTLRFLVGTIGGIRYDQMEALQKLV